MTSQFADLSSVGCCLGERGLLSVAVAPDFDTTGRLYVDYTDEAPGRSTSTKSAQTDATAPSLETLRSLLTIPHPDETNHNGGQLQFGPDGDLYISTGDGGGGNDEFHNAQNLNSLLGKILRIRPDPGGALPYTVPAGNPFPGATAPYDTIWSYGLRNPYRFSFDSLNGNMVIGDVGQDEREEVDFAPATFRRGRRGRRQLRLELPRGLHRRARHRPAVRHAAGRAASPNRSSTTRTPRIPTRRRQRCAIIGGYVVRDPSLGALYGRYLYADLCAGDLRSLQLPAEPHRPAQRPTARWASQVDNPVSFGEDGGEAPLCGRGRRPSSASPARRRRLHPARAPPQPDTARPSSPPSSASRHSGGGSNAASGHC